MNTPAHIPDRVIQHRIPVALVVLFSLSVLATGAAMVETVEKERNELRFELLEANSRSERYRWYLQQAKQRLATCTEPAEGDFAAPGMLFYSTGARAFMCTDSDGMWTACLDARLWAAP